MTAAMLLAAMAAAAPSQPQPALDGDQDAAPPAGVLLVEVDKITEDRLDEITQWVQAGRYDEAQEALHNLMTSQGPPALHPVPGDAWRYETTIEAAARLLGTFPEEALDLYCKRHDLAAEKLFEAARRDGDEAALASVGRRYFHTPHGGKALATAAAMAFDRGRHTEAAPMWERLYRKHRRIGADRAMLLAKAAVAWHLAGQPDRAAAMLGEMKQRHAAAEAVVAGRRTSLPAFLSAALAGGANLPTTPLSPTGDWPSLAGSPGSVAVMADCDPAPLPLWTDAAGVRSSRVQGLLGVALGPAVSPDQPFTVALESGRVRVRRPVPGQPDLRFDFPPLVHPVVVRGVLMCRREAAVVATSLESGRELWRVEGLPMHQDAAGGQAAANPAFALAGDMGRYVLTVGDGRLYTVGRFSRLGGPTHRLADAETLAAGDGSSLVALLLRPNGADPAWEVGNSKGSHESLRQAKWLTAPTLHNGRLYAIARLGNRYAALCLDAAGGALIWETPLGLVPMRGGVTMSWQQAYALEVVTERGSPLAVAEGRVFCTTNAGVVAALDAATGAPLWAYRYDSRVSGPADRPSVADLQGQAIRVATLRQPCRPVNPLLVAAGRLVCLPCDSDAVLALSAQNGELLWQRDRQGQDDLTALDDATALLSGPNLVVLSLEDGAVRQRWEGGLLGRPAVTAGPIIASGEGGIVRADPARGTLDRRPLADDEAVLGHMVSADGRLAAVNAAGCSLYADYPTIREALRLAAEKAGQPGRQAALALKAGMLAMSAGRLDDAARELAEAGAAARKAAESQISAKADERLFEVRLRQFRDAGADPRAGTYLDHADRLAATADERKQVLLARVQYSERLGRPAEAAAALQAVLDRQADQWSSKGGGSLQEYFLARRELAAVIRRHGQDVYAPFDAKMEAALDRALAGNDPSELAALSRRWPAARRAGEALIQAADLEFRLAVAGPQPDFGRAAKAARLLGEARGKAGDETRAKALAAQAILDLRLRPNLAGALAAELDAVGPSTPIRFGGFEGTVGDLVRRVAEARRRPLPPEDPPLADLALPLRPAYEVTGEATDVLRDTHGRTVRLGDRVFLCAGGKLACLDPHRGDPQAATLWTADLPPQTVPSERLGQFGSDGRRLAVLDKNSLLVVDALSGKEVGRSDMAWLGPRGWIQAVGDRDWLVLADERAMLTCLSTADGSLVWRWRPTRFGFGGLSAWSEVLLVRDRSAGSGICCDARTGCVLAELKPRDPRTRTAMAVLNPEGLVVTLDDDGTVSVRDVRQPPGGQWPSAAWGNAGWRPLAAGERFVALRSTAGDGRVRVLDLAEPKRPIDLWASDDHDRLPQPVWLTFDGQRAVLLHAQEARTDGLAAPGLTAFEMPSGKRLWQRALAPASAGLWRNTTPCLYGGILGLTLRSPDGQREVHPYVLKIEDGETFDCAAARTDAAAAWPRAESPVVLNGWVVVPHQAGWACLVSAKP
jgi:outer membrane protein assembly factor BamB